MELHFLSLGNRCVEEVGVVVSTTSLSLSLSCCPCWIDARMSFRNSLLLLLLNSLLLLLVLLISICWWMAATLDGSSDRVLKSSIFLLLLLIWLLLFLLLFVIVFKLLLELAEEDELNKIWLFELELLLVALLELWGCCRCGLVELNIGVEFNEDIFKRTLLLFKLLLILLLLILLLFITASLLLLSILSIAILLELVNELCEKDSELLSEKLGSMSPDPMMDDWRKLIPSKLDSVPSSIFSSLVPFLETSNFSRFRTQLKFLI